MRSPLASRSFAALAALAVSLGGAIAVLPAAPASAATHVVSTQREFDLAIDNLQAGDVVEVVASVISNGIDAQVPFTLSVAAGATVTAPAMASVSFVKTGAGVLRVLDFLTANGSVTVQAGTLEALTLATQQLQVLTGASLLARDITATGNVAIGGVLEADVFQAALSGTVTVSGSATIRRVVDGTPLWNVSGLLETADMTLGWASEMTITGELRLTGTFTNLGSILNNSRITGSATVLNQAIIRGPGSVSMIESIAGHNHRLELTRPGTTEVVIVRVLAPSLATGEQRMPVPGSPDGVLFRGWTVGGVTLDGATSLRSIGTPVACAAQPTLGCGYRTVATPAWDELAFTAPPQVGVPTTATFTGAETPTIAVDGVIRPGTSITPAPADAGLPIRARVTATYPSGYTLTTGTTEVSTTIALGDIAPGAVAIVGDPRVGEQLRADVSGFAPAPDRVDLVWSTPLGTLGTGDRIVVPAAAAGQPITVTATAIAAGYADEVVTSGAVVVAAAPEAPPASAAALPTTGAEPLPGLVGASVLLAAGAALLLRRRRLARR